MSYDVGKIVDLKQDITQQFVTDVESGEVQAIRRDASAYIATLEDIVCAEAKRKSPFYSLVSKFYKKPEEEQRLDTFTTRFQKVSSGYEDTETGATFPYEDKILAVAVGTGRITLDR